MKYNAWHTQNVYGSYEFFHHDDDDGMYHAQCHSVHAYDAPCLNALCIATMVAIVTPTLPRMLRAYRTDDAQALARLKRHTTHRKYGKRRAKILRTRLVSD
jgi:hypothetical protein